MAELQPGNGPLDWESAFGELFALHGGAPAEQTGPDWDAALAAARTDQERHDLGELRRLVGEYPIQLYRNGAGHVDLRTDEAWRSNNGKEYVYAVALLFDLAEAAVQRCLGQLLE